jgi:hypothetical protein
MQNSVRKLALVILIASAVAAVANAQSDSSLCNDKLIKGVYGFTVVGDKLAGSLPIGPQVGVAMTEFFGDTPGTMQQIDSVIIDGVHLSHLTELPTQGSYTVNSNCTGSFTLNFTDGRPWVYTDFVIVDNGNEIDTVVTGVSVDKGMTILPALATRSIGKRRFTPLFDVVQ